jgi:hypothetical protein
VHVNVINAQPPAVLSVAPPATCRGHHARYRLLTTPET